ncbi:MAG: ATP-binding cassette domain-containing protein [Proteobacteria bacterium]|nr:ATP-binding cassette domain-containing protein [Pseudomonadota bacterium]
MSVAAINLDRITKRFADHVAVNGVSLSVPSGGVFGLLGPNGAGKSTTIRMIMDILKPDEGTISLFGSASRGRNFSHRVGYLPEERGLYKKMRVFDHLLFLAEIRGLSRADAKGRAHAWLDRLGIGEWTGKKVEDLSKGMQQKVQFAGALVHDPDLLILDEPFAGLDPVNAQVMKDIVVDVAKEGKTVVLSTHVMEQAERMCDQIAIIARGKLVLHGSVAQVKSDFGGSHIALGFNHGGERADSILSDRQLVDKFDHYGATVELQLAPGASSDELLHRLVNENISLRRFEIVEPSLNTIFIAKVGEEASVATRTGEAHE